MSRCGCYDVTVFGHHALCLVGGWRNRSTATATVIYVYTNTCTT